MDTADDPQYVLVLTASIRPSPGVEVQRNDPQVRLDDYCKALRFWLTYKDSRLTRIVFLENSESDLSALHELVRNENIFEKQVEFIHTLPLIIPDGIHYGWGELKMLDEGFRQSRLIAESTHLVKVTGRLVFPCTSDLLDRVPKNLEAMVDCRVTTTTDQKSLRFLPPLARRIVSLLPALLLRKRAYATTQIMIISRAFYQQHLLGSVDMMRSDYLSVMESLIFHQLKPLATRNTVRLRFPVNCEPVGVGATAQQDYNSKSRKYAATVRAYLRPLGIWL